jgi:hypothetical protein
MRQVPSAVRHERNVCAGMSSHRVRRRKVVCTMAAHHYDGATALNIDLHGLGLVYQPRLSLPPSWASPAAFRTSPQGLPSAPHALKMPDCLTGNVVRGVGWGWGHVPVVIQPANPRATVTQRQVSCRQMTQLERRTGRRTSHARVDVSQHALPQRVYRRTRGCSRHLRQAGHAVRDMGAITWRNAWDTYGRHVVWADDGWRWRWRWRSSVCVRGVPVRSH